MSRIEVGGLEGEIKRLDEKIGFALPHARKVLAHILQVHRNKSYLNRIGEKWMGLVFDPTTADRGAAEAALACYCRAKGEELPQMLWFESPFQALLAMLELSPKGKAIQGKNIDRVVPLHLEGFGSEFLVLPPVSLLQMMNECIPELSKKVRKLLFHQSYFPHGMRFREMARPLERLMIHGLTHALADHYGKQTGQAVSRRRIARLTAWFVQSKRFASHCVQQMRQLTLLEVELIHEALPDPERACLAALLDLGANCGGLVRFGGKVFLIDRPAHFRRDGEDRFHCEDGPAIGYRDGWGAYAWHGTPVPRWMIEEPIRVKNIDQERNQEYRRIMLERMGMERFLADSGARFITKDPCGELFVREMPEGEAIFMVKVINSSPEPDGTFKEYVLRVPPNVRTPREAVAWTFGMGEGEYQPMVET